MSGGACQDNYAFEGKHVSGCVLAWFLERLLSPLSLILLCVSCAGLDVIEGPAQSHPHHLAQRPSHGVHPQPSVAFPPYNLTHNLHPPPNPAVRSVYHLYERA